MVSNVKINGTDYPMLWGWNAIRKFSEETKVNMLNIDREIVTRIDYLFLAIFIAISEGYRVEGKQSGNLTIESLGDAFDKDPAAVERSLKVLREQMNMMLDVKKKTATDQPKK